MSLRAIAKALGRSKSVVHSFLKDPATYGSKKRKGRTRKMTECDRQIMFREAIIKKKSSSQISALLSVSVSSRTVQRELQRNDSAKYLERNQGPQMMPHHKAARVKWARNQIKQRTDWGKIIFSGEKKFNLDGPDGLKHYWHDLRSEKDIYWSRQNSDDSVMVWGAFSKTGKTKLAMLEGRQEPFDYQETLTTYLFPFANGEMNGNYIFQHDNASIHLSRATKDFLSDRNIPVLLWPALSPDLNPIENLWGDMVRAVYACGRQYDSISKLKEAILRAWESISQARLDTLADSMYDRCLDVVSEHGSKI